MDESNGRPLLRAAARGQTCGGEAAVREQGPRILLVDAESLYAEAMASRLARAGIEVVAACATLERAVDVLSSTECDVVLVDPEADGGDDDHAYRQLSRATSARLVLASSSLED